MLLSHNAPVKIRYQSLEVRLEVLYYPLLLLFNYNMMALLGVILPTFPRYERRSKVCKWLKIEPYAPMVISTGERKWKFFCFLFCFFIIIFYFFWVEKLIKIYMVGRVTRVGRVTPIKHLFFLGLCKIPNNSIAVLLRAVSHDRVTHHTLPVYSHGQRWPISAISTAFSSKVKNGFVNTMI